MPEVATETRKVLAKAGAVAWMNAAIASGSDKDRPQLFRTLSVEFFPRGVQLIGCNGFLLFRCWAPYSDIGDLPAPHPEIDEAPDDAVVVSDRDKFALGFMKILNAACEDYDELEIVIEAADDEEDPALGEELAEHVLTLEAHGQRLSCPLYDGPFPDWRRLEFGLDAGERVDGMALSVKAFQAVGKLKGVGGVDCSFRGEEKAVEIRSFYDGGVSLRGLLMPMRRREPTKRTEGAEQTEH